MSQARRTALKRAHVCYSAAGAARKEELRVEPALELRAEAWERMGLVSCGVRWLDHNYGDAERREQRSSLVVQEARRTASTSSTPPLEGVRLSCSWAMSMTGFVLQ